MSTNVGSIHYDLHLDTSAFDKAAGSIAAKTQKIGNKMSSVGKTMTKGLTLPIVAGFGYAVKAASDLNETLNKIDVAFKDQSKEVKKWANTSITSMGLARQSALDAAALFGDMSTSMGLSTKAAAKMSTNLVQLGADLASFKNIRFEEAQTALSAIYTGETESLKRLGIVMTEVNLLEFAKAKGIKKSIKDMTQAEKVQLRYNFVMDKTKNAQGDFIRTQGGTANQLRMTQERFKQLAAEIGAKLLPIANKLLGIIQGWIDKFRSLSPETKRIIMIVLGVIAVLGPLLIFFGKIITAVGLIIKVVQGFSKVMRLISVTSPWFLAIIALVAIALLVIKNWDKVKIFFVGLWNKIKSIFFSIKNFIVSTWQSIHRTVTSLVTRVKNWIVDKFNAVVRFIKGIPGAIKKALSTIYDVITWPFRKAFNAVVSIYNATLGKVFGKIGSAAGESRDAALARIKKQAPGVVHPDAYRAKGGPVSAGMSYMVGERGRELFVPKKDGTIIPNHNLGKMTSSTQIYGNINIGSKQDAHYFLSRLNRSQDLLSMGLSPL